MPIHLTKQGECLSKIAHLHGFADWRTIYNHPRNDDLRKKRPDPDLIYPGDSIFIPDRAEKRVPCAASHEHRFVLRRPRRVLRLAFEDRRGERIANAPYKLLVGDSCFEGTTDGDGVLEAKIPMHLDEGSVEVGGRVWPLKIGYLNPIEDAPDDGVAGIQARLLNLGYLSGPIDGKLGPRTERAIRAFQSSHPPLAVDGICGPKTRAKLIEKHGC